MTSKKNMTEPAPNKPKAARRKRRLLFATAGILAVALGAWVLWPRTHHWQETTLDLGNNVKMRLVLIPAGKFMMGSSDNEANPDKHEGPQHEVTLSKPFYMGVFEVTQEQYEQVMGVNPSHFKGTTNPVEMVSWDDAVEFCKRLSAKTAKKVRLPTKAEWEYACRAGTTTAFNTGDDLKPSQANAYFFSSPGVWDKVMDGVRKFFPTKAKAHGTTPVGSFPPNGFGLYDTHGNVLQWCGDWYDDDYYANSPKTDPTGPATGQYRVFRGGSWFGLPGYCRSACRGRDVPGVRGSILGFRVVVLPGLD